MTNSHFENNERIKQILCFLLDVECEIRNCLPIVSSCHRYHYDVRYVRKNFNIRFKSLCCLFLFQWQKEKRRICLTIYRWMTKSTKIKTSHFTF